MFWFELSFKEKIERLGITVGLIALIRSELGSIWLILFLAVVFSILHDHVVRTRKRIELLEQEIASLKERL